ncbi:hypothetical protein TRFO_02214 [Tritrichomonas foetus]|uniref:Tectonic-1-3 N-terminal domain-containing protein n=1 Tax=Tritrichomonas foetus TaxID=1144522 RepID=A0A1J4JCV2_9EUKA|nr:hypothetical protein TRFO_02214 [Tritrichomonas foetus]|eukprot:OHS95237.1 hypothetical protein TRFO_02214 [Tritrichomonas foetus]
MMLFLSLLPLFSHSLNEASFTNVNSCVCAIKQNQCNPYCCCDPNCPSTLNFSFCLPESLGSAKISCDPSFRIDKPNIAAINQIEINNVTCYVVDGEDTGSTIINFPPQDFGLDNFSQITDIPVNTTRFDPNVTEYQVGDYLLLSPFETTVGKITYLPVGVGSSTCNTMVPFRFGVNYPNYTCRVPKVDSTSQNPYANYIRDSVLLEYVSSRDGHSIIFGNGESGGFTIDSSFSSQINQVLLYVQYLYQYNATEGNVSFFQVIRSNNPADAKIQGVSNNDFLVFGHQVFFSESAIDTTGNQEFQFGNMAYYYGVPLMVAVYPITDTLFDSLLQRQPLTINNENVLFGVNSSFVIQLSGIKQTTDPGNATACGFTFEPNQTILDQLNQSKIDYCQIRKTLYPTAYNNLINERVAAYVFNTYGNAFSTYYANHNFGTNFYATLDSWHISNNIKYPTAQWTFFYKRFNTKSTPLYTLMNLTVSVGLPSNITYNEDGTTMGMINVVFIELDDNGNLFQKQETEPYSGKLSMVFDTFFVKDSDALRTIGIFFCFALLATIWCWYMCFFYIE